MDTTALFADTYALVELGKGNPRYAPFATATIVTTKLNIAEYYYFLLRNFGRDIADAQLIRLQRTVAVTNESIRIGMAFKLAYRKEKLSYADCIGYALALELDIPFLTGDEKFLDKPNVTFVQ